MSLSRRVWRQKAKRMGQIHGAWTGIVERQVFPPQPGCVSISSFKQSGRSQKDRSRSLADGRDLPRPRHWQGRNWDLLQGSAGWVEHLSKWRPASILSFPRVRLKLAWRSCRAVCQTSVCISQRWHNLERFVFSAQESFRGGRAGLEIKMPQQSFVIR